MGAMDVGGLIMALFLAYAGSSGLLEMRIYRRSPFAIRRVMKFANPGFGAMLAAGVWKLGALAMASYLRPIPGVQDIRVHLYEPIMQAPAALAGVGVLLLLAAFRSLLKGRTTTGTGGPP